MNHLKIYIRKRIFYGTKYESSLNLLRIVPKIPCANHHIYLDFPVL